MTFEEFITRWTESSDAERANKDAFLGEVCHVLGVDPPNPTTGEVEQVLASLEALGHLISVADEPRRVKLGTELLFSVFGSKNSSERKLSSFAPAVHCK